MTSGQRNKMLQRTSNESQKSMYKTSAQFMADLQSIIEQRKSRGMQNLNQLANVEMQLGNQGKEAILARAYTPGIGAGLAQMGSTAMGIGANMWANEQYLNQLGTTMKETGAANASAWKDAMGNVQASAPVASQFVPPSGPGDMFNSALNMFGGALGVGGGTPAAAGNSANAAAALKSMNYSVPAVQGTQTGSPSWQAAMGQMSYPSPTMGPSAQPTYGGWPTSSFNIFSGAPSYGEQYNYNPARTILSGGSL